MLAVTILLTVAVGTMTVWVLVNAYRIRSLPPLIPPSTLGAGIVMYWLLGHAALFADHERLKRLIAKHGRTLHDSENQIRPPPPAQVAMVLPRFGSSRFPP